MKGIHIWDHNILSAPLKQKKNAGQNGLKNFNTSILGMYTVSQNYTINQELSIDGWLGIEVVWLHVTAGGFSAFQE